MAEVVTAIYEKGVLRPLEPLHLRERQQVRIQIMPQETADPVETALGRLVQAGVLTPPEGQSNVPPLSETERQTLAQRLRQTSGKLTSEMIIEDRGDR